MIALGFGVIWAGYLYTVYGWVLLKGWNIRWRDMANPIHPYQWPPLGTDPPLIPKGQILPTGMAGSPGAASAGGKGSPPAPVI